MKKMKRITVTLTPDLAVWLAETSKGLGDDPGVSWLVRRAIRHYRDSGRAADELSGLKG